MAIDELPIGVLENDAEVLETIEQALLLRDCRPQALASMAQAIDFAVAVGDGIMIVDLNMGSERRTEGLDVIERIKQLRPDLRICLYSQHVSAGNPYVRRAKRMGVDFVIPKSVNIFADVERIMAAFGYGLAREFEDAFDAPIEIAENERRRQSLQVKLKYKGRSQPIPFDNPWSNEGKEDV